MCFNLVDCDIVNIGLSFSGGLFVGGILALRYIAPQMYYPLLTLLKIRVEILESIGKESDGEQEIIDPKQL